MSAQKREEFAVTWYSDLKTQIEKQGYTVEVRESDWIIRDQNGKLVSTKLYDRSTES